MTGVLKIGKLSHVPSLRNMVENGELIICTEQYLVPVILLSSQDKSCCELWRRVDRGVEREERYASRLFT